MTPLEKLLIDEIDAKGPIPLSRFMSLCLSHPKYGYYITQNPIGKSGDFVTAPEISQLFGEMIGIWLLNMWEIQGRKPVVNLIELGPGNGTLMADILRVAKQFPSFAEALHVHLIEISPMMVARQKSVITWDNIQWHDTLSDVPTGNSFIVANEFFDALPIDQAKKTNNGWVDLSVTNGITGFEILQNKPHENKELDIFFPDVKTGMIVEHSQQRDRIAQEIGARIRHNGGAALIIDYGEWTGTGDTFQALGKHGFANPLKQVGKVDLTSHVNFKQIARISGCDHKFTTQGKYLEFMNIAERAHQLCAGAENKLAKKISAAHHRLTHPKEMGTLFKVLALHSNEFSKLPGFGGIS